MKVTVIIVLWLIALAVIYAFLKGCHTRDREGLNRVEEYDDQND